MRRLKYKGAADSAGGLSKPKPKRKKNPDNSAMDVDDDQTRPSQGPKQEMSGRSHVTDRPFPAAITSNIPTAVNSRIMEHLYFNQRMLLTTTLVVNKDTSGFCSLRSLMGMPRGRPKLLLLPMHFSLFHCGNRLQPLCPSFSSNVLSTRPLSSGIFRHLLSRT